MERRNPFLLLSPGPLPHEGDKPLEICLVRGEAIESRHRVHVMVTDGDGETVHRWGNPSLTFFPRSAIKMIQAASWVSRGFDREWKLGDEERALACASHQGEDIHVRTANAWLERLGYSEATLACGTHYPYATESSHELIRKGEAPSQLHNNCSGKHSGLLTLCKGCGWSPEGYTNYDHPVQQALRDTLGKFLGMEMNKAQWGIDGCGIPTYSVPLERMAAGMGKLADPSTLDKELKTAVKSLNASVAAKPLYLGGTESFSSKVVSETEGRVFAKVGAEGVYGAWIPQAGLGLAFKCEDGTARAAEMAVATVLRELGFPLGFFSPFVKRWTGEVVGQFFLA